MSSKVSEMAEQLIRPFADSLGLTVIEVEYQKKHNGMNLTVFIDKPGGVGLLDCEALHRAIDGPLDTLDPTQGAPYTLNVSSPGLDRPIKTPADFARQLGKEIDVRLYAPLKGNIKNIVGVLTGFSDGVIFVEQKDGSVTQVSQKDAAKVTLKIEI